jgi:predicted HTH domain antitoxin
MELNSIKKVTLEFPIGALTAMRQTSEEFSKSMRLAAAVKWYEMGIISQEKASEIAGLNREDFLLSLIEYKVSPFQYTDEDILKEGRYE